MQSVEELIGKPVPQELEFTETVSASCADFRSAHGAFQEFWRPLGLYAGDFDLVIYRADPGAGSFGDRCSAFGGVIYEEAMSYAGRKAPSAWTREHLEMIGWLEPELSPEELLERELYEEEYGVDEPRDWIGTPIGEALWTLGSFSVLCWDWGAVSRRLGSTSEGEEVSSGAPMARAFATLGWSDGLERIEGVAQHAQAELAGLAEPLEGVSREQFAALMAEDFDRLRALCGEGRVAASGLCTDPQTPVQRALTISDTGNERIACLETESDWYGIRFLTS